MACFGHGWLVLLFVGLKSGRGLISSINDFDGNNLAGLIKYISKYPMEYLSKKSIPWNK